MKNFPTIFTRGAVNRTIPIDILMEKVSPREAIRFAYVPTVVANAAIRYAKQICDYCAMAKLPYKLQTRAIREHSALYTKQSTQNLSWETYKKLEDQTNDFFYSTDKHLKTLYWTVNSELLKRYPDLNDNHVYTVVYIAHSLLRYVREFQNQSEIRMSELCDMTIRTEFDPELKIIRSNLEEITGNYTIGRTEMIDLAIKIISIQIDQHVFSDVEIVKD